MAKKNIQYPKRIGIEAELRTYNIDKQNRVIKNNKILLAKSDFIVEDGELQYPYIQIYSEGESTGNYYLELVFAPVKIANLVNVHKCIEEAKKISGVKTFSEWVVKFNEQLLKLNLPFKLTLIVSDAKYENLDLVPMTGTLTYSVQSNVSIPLTALLDEKIQTLFQGSNFYEKFIPLQKTIIKKAKERIYSDQKISLLVLIAYMCAIFAKNGKDVNENLLKQSFHVLPKISAKKIWEEVFLSDTTIKSEIEFFLSGLQESDFTNIDTLRSKELYNSIQFFKNNFTREDIHPRDSGLLDISFDVAGIPYIVLEIRKDDALINNAIKKDGVITKEMYPFM
jgi:hypothetical protein